MKNAGVKKAITYGYDSAGMRVSLRENTAGGVTATVFPTSSYSETTRADGIVEHAVSVEVAGMPIATIRIVGTSTPEVFATHTDHLRSTRLVTSEASGAGTVNIVEQTDYDAFGKITNHQQSGDFAERKKYTSHEFDSATNYTYAKARYLDTSAGRFASQDPAYLLVGSREFDERYNRSLESFLADPQLLNSYSYARNNPIKFVDEDGEMNAIKVFGKFAGPFGILFDFLFSPSTAYSPESAANLAQLQDDASKTEGGFAVVGVVAGLATGGGADDVAKAIGKYGDDAAKAGQKLLNPTIEFSQKYWKHIVDEHTVTGVKNAGKSIFNAGEDIEKLIRQATQLVPQLQKGGNFERVLDVGRNIGVDRVTGGQTSIMTVITNKASDLITAFPGAPKK